MFYSYDDCISRYGTNYFLEKAVRDGNLFKVENGIYSDSSTWRELALIAFKNKEAIFTMESAFYYHGLTDVVPEHYTLGTDRDFTKIRDQRVHQYFFPDNLLMLGVEEKEVNGVSIKIHTKERLLIELIRRSNKLPFDYYKEIMGNYRNKIFELDEEWLEDNVPKFPGSKKIMNAIRLEVF